MLLKPLGILRSTRWCNFYPSVACGRQLPFQGSLGRGGYAKPLLKGEGDRVSGGAVIPLKGEGGTAQAVTERVPERRGEPR